MPVKPPWKMCDVTPEEDIPKGEGKNFCEMLRRCPDRTNVWLAWVEKNRVFVQWGELEGVIHQKTRTFKSSGKPRLKGYVSANQAARDFVSKRIGEMHKAGFKLWNEIRSMIDFTAEMIPTLRWSKPLDEPLQEDTMAALSKKRDPLCSSPLLQWTLKVRGLEHTVSKDMSGNVWIQTDCGGEGLEVVNDKYPHLVEEFDALLPPRSIFLVILYMGSIEYADLDLMMDIDSCYDKQAKAIQKRDGLAKAYIFRVPFWKGSDMEGPRHRIDGWMDFIDSLTDGWPDKSRPANMQLGFADTDFCTGLIKLGDNYVDAAEEFDAWKASGAVVYRSDKSIGDLGYSTDGMVNRPPVSWSVWED